LVVVHKPSLPKWKSSIDAKSKDETIIKLITMVYLKYLFFWNGRVLFFTVNSTMSFSQVKKLEMRRVLTSPSPRRSLDASSDLSNENRHNFYVSIKSNWNFASVIQTLFPMELAGHGQEPAQIRPRRYLGFFFIFLIIFEFLS
jgi:hypothetical protein